MRHTYSRRKLLSTASSIGLVALAGCSGGSDDADDENESDGDPAADDPEESPDNESDGEDDTDGDEQETPPEPVDWTGEERGTVSVAPDGFVFDPDSVQIRPGTTVRWLWESGGHNVAPVRQPDAADWSGERDVSGEGHSYEFTFETPGVYEYVCEPHQGQGMRGYVIVESS